MNNREQRYFWIIIIAKTSLFHHKKLSLHNFYTCCCCKTPAEKVQYFATRRFVNWFIIEGSRLYSLGLKYTQIFSSTCFDDCDLSSPVTSSLALHHKGNIYDKFKDHRKIIIITILWMMMFLMKSLMDFHFITERPKDLLFPLLLKTLKNWQGLPCYVLQIFFTLTSLPWFRNCITQNCFLIDKTPHSGLDNNISRSCFHILL